MITLKASLSNKTYIMTAWFKTSELRNKVGIITDYLIDDNKHDYYLELKDIDTGLYYIVHVEKVEFIV